MISNNIDYKKATLDEVINGLKVDIETGLTYKEVDKRLKEYGYNEVSEKKQNLILSFLKRFWGLTAWMLEAVIILSFILGKYLDMYLIAILLILNAILGFIQEQKASKAVEALKQKLRISARTLRDGKWQLLTANLLVPGDIIRIRAGDFVPADLKIIDGHVDVDQSALTGESLTSTKEKSDLIYSGSIVKSGESNAIVVLTGSRTLFGEMTELVQIARPKLHMEEIISKIVKWLLIIVIIAIIAAFVASLFMGINLFEILPLSLVLLASSIPVALPAMFTMSMAIGSTELVKHGVLITRLNASEDAATMDTLCLDKTGTITMNKLSIVDSIPMNNFKNDDVIMYGALASQEANNDPIDLAFLNAAKDNKQFSSDNFKQKSFTPFDPKTRRTVAVIESNGKTFKVIKGAVNIIADLAKEDIKSLNERTTEYASKGYRTLAVAIDYGQGNIKIVGLAALYDMPRPDAKKLMDDLRNLGVSIKILTGDALPIAIETAKRVGLKGTITLSSEFEKEMDKNPAKAADIIEKSEGFAEIYPQDKYTIVKSLQSKGHIVGMTGDGVNDAPSLKQAEVGIAVNNATDVAKGAASVVLMGKELTNILDLIKIGRMIYQRIITWILNKVVKTFQIVVFVVIAFFLTHKFIVSAYDVVLLLLFIDFVTLSISTDNVRWSKTPDVWDVSGIVKTSVILGALVVLESLAILYIGFAYFGLGSNIGLLNTYSFSIIFYFGLLSVFVVRERGHFWNSVPSKSLLYIILIDMLLVGAVVTLGIPGLKPLPLVDTLSVVGMSAFFSFVINDFAKYLLFKQKVE